MQNFLSREALLRHVADRLPAETNISSFNRAAISVSIPDPDVPVGYELDPSEYTTLMTLLFTNFDFNYKN